jgi:ribosome-binding factor A
MENNKQNLGGGKPESQRQKKVARLLQKELSEIFLQKSSAWFENLLISVTNLRVTADLGIAYIYLSCLSDTNNRMMHIVEDHSKAMKQELVSRIRQQLRYMPELHFFKDDSYEYALKMGQVFNELNIPSEEEARKQEEALQKIYKKTE